MENRNFFLSDKFLKEKVNKYNYLVCLRDGIFYVDLSNNKKLELRILREVLTNTIQSFIDDRTFTIKLKMEKLKFTLYCLVMVLVNQKEVFWLFMNAYLPKFVVI